MLEHCWLHVVRHSEGDTYRYGPQNLSTVQAACCYYCCTRGHGRARSGLDDLPPIPFLSCLARVGTRNIPRHPLGNILIVRRTTLKWCIMRTIAANTEQRARHHQRRRSIRTTRHSTTNRPRLAEWKQPALPTTRHASKNEYVRRNAPTRLQQHRRDE